MEKEKMKMQEQELEQVAGGQTYWYTHIANTWTDPITGQVREKGYLIRGLDLVTGRKSESIWIAESEWKDWKEEMEYNGHVLRKGDANPQD